MCTSAWVVYSAVCNVAMRGAMLPAILRRNIEGVRSFVLVPASERTHNTAQLRTSYKGRWNWKQPAVFVFDLWCSLSVHGHLLDGPAVR